VGFGASLTTRSAFSASICFKYLQSAWEIATEFSLEFTARSECFFNNWVVAHRLNPP
jgi:hypothetical protein